MAEAGVDAMTSALDKTAPAMDRARMVRRLRLMSSRLERESPARPVCGPGLTVAAGDVDDLAAHDRHLRAHFEQPARIRPVQREQIM